jgi:hypothetical protein
MKAKVDAILNKWLSRKLLVFVTATVLTLIGQVDSKDWVDVALVYTMSEAAIDAVTRLRGVLPTKKEDPQV